MNRKTTYSELLKDPRWQKVRLKKLEAAEWMCESCYDNETMLSVHHKRYVKGRMPWEYDDHELAVLCQPCHEVEHEAKELRSELVARLHVDGPASAHDFFAVAAGYIGEQTNDEGLGQVTRQFGAETPYQHGIGRFAALFERHMRLSMPGINFMCEALEAGSEHEFFADLYAALKKHGVQCPPAGPDLD